MKSGGAYIFRLTRTEAPRARSVARRGERQDRCGAIRDGTAISIMRSLGGSNAIRAHHRMSLSSISASATPSPTSKAASRMASEAHQAFFVVVADRGSTYDTDFLKAEGSTYGDPPRCEVCGRPIGMRRWLPPFRAELKLYGSDWGDFAFFGPAQFLVSDRAVAAIAKTDLSGLTGFEPVEAVTVEGGVSPPTYRQVVIALNGAAVDESESSLVRSGDIACDACRSNGVDAIHGFALEPGTWTGQDIFIPRGLPGVVVATERVTQVVKDHGLTNIRFVPTAMYEWDAMAPVAGAG